MISFFSAWSQNIIVGVIITVIIELVLPEGTSKKYLKIVLGLYVLSIVIAPIIDTNSINTNFLENMENSINNNSAQTMSIDIDKSVEKVYKDSITREIKKYLDNCGFDVKKIELNIETENEDKYGLVKEIEMTLSLKDDESIEIVREVEIKNTDGVKIEESKKTTIFESIEEYLNINYGVNKRSIIINIE